MGALCAGMARGVFCVRIFANLVRSAKFCSTFASEMKLTDQIRAFFRRSDNHILAYNRGGYVFDFSITKHRFGETIFLNIAELLTDLYAEVEWTGADTPKFRAWKAWANRNGRRILTSLLTRKGYAVIGYDSELDASGEVQYRFYELTDQQYTTIQRNDYTEVVCFDPMQRYYVLKSPTFDSTGHDDRYYCDGYIRMIDAVLNGATTTAERLGAYVVMSPKADQMGGILTAEEKDALEKELQREYGMLKDQKQIMTLPRPMDSQVVSLAGVDTKFVDKARTAILAIADRLKVPANQIAIIDANASKSLSNGTELREGDLSKYRSFRRLLNGTLFDMAYELGMQVDYTIENEPKTTQGQEIENDGQTI